MHSKKSRTLLMIAMVVLITWEQLWFLSICRDDSIYVSYSNILTFSFDAFNHTIDCLWLTDTARKGMIGLTIHNLTTAYPLGRTLKTVSQFLYHIVIKHTICDNHFSMSKFCSGDKIDTTTASWHCLVVQTGSWAGWPHYGT